MARKAIPMELCMVCDKRPCECKVTRREKVLREQTKKDGWADPKSDPVQDVIDYAAQLKREYIEGGRRSGLLD